MSDKITIECDTNNVSDGYHTFGELYEHRIVLYMALCREMAKYPNVYPRIWRTRLHSDGSSFDGWFVLGINSDAGKQITYHLPDSKWKECGFFATTFDRAPDFDGHTPADVLERLGTL